MIIRKTTPTELIAAGETRQGRVGASARFLKKIEAAETPAKAKPEPHAPDRGCRPSDWG